MRHNDTNVIHKRLTKAEKSNILLRKWKTINAVRLPFLSHHEINALRMPLSGKKSAAKAPQHRGEIVAAAVRKSGVKLTSLHSALRISRPTLYRRFEDPRLDFDFIEEVGKLISYDFAADFPELRVRNGLVAEPLAAYSIDNLAGCKDQLLHVYGLYTEVLQKYNALLETSQG